MKVYISDSPEETQNIGKTLATILKKGDIIALKGNVGAGKTCFVKGLAKGLGVCSIVSSPTYSIINEYYGNINLCHCDMYRIKYFDDLESTGFFDYIEDNKIIAIEWSENIKNFLPSTIITVNIDNMDQNIRKITITGDERIENIGN